ncbi:MAG TPA: LytR/AlgR family response regulator transcription factor [Cyclobacteriaceae bacterium]
MKTIIIDDERLARKELTNLLADREEIDITDEAVNMEDAILKINKHKPDLIFLDIQMPGGTGFDLLEQLLIVPKVIFTTAYDDYAIKAFEYNAFDYLLKPIQPERLGEAIERIMRYDQEVHHRSKKEERKLNVDDQVFVKDGEKCWFVRLSEVRLFESDGNYIKVYFKNFKPMIHKSLNALEERLDERAFFRASRKHIINLTWVKAIETWFNGGLLVELEGGEKVEVSRRQASRFKEMMSL